jgi:hypothetical protein
MKKDTQMLEQLQVNSQFIHQDNNSRGSQPLVGKARLAT